MVVARNLAREGNGETRDSLGRDGFIGKVGDWKQHSGDTIERQMRRLGASGDWSRSVFTMDPMAANAVIEAFVRLHEEGLVYRSEEHTSELQSLMRISYAVFCLKKKQKNRT